MNKNKKYCMKNELKNYENDTKLKVIFFLILLVSGSLLIGTITQGHIWGGDFAAYIMQANSIVEGNMQAYIDLNRFTIEQSSWPMGPIAYPWGFPLLLTPIYALFDNNIYAFKFIGILSYLLFLITLWPIFRKTHTGIGFILLVSLFAFNPAMLVYSNYLGSDLPFLFISTVGVWLIQRIVVSNKIISSTIFELIFLGIIMAFAFFVRTNGFLLLGTLGVSYLVYFFYNKRKKSLFLPKWKFLFWILLPFMTFFIFVLIWKAYFPSGGESHLELLQKISLYTLKRNLIYYAQLLSDFFRCNPYSDIIFLVTTPLLAIGMAKRYRSDYPYIIYMILTPLLYIIWPIRQDLRFLFPILPFYISFTISGYEILVKTVGRNKKYFSQIFYLPIVILVICFFSENIHKIKDNLKNYTRILPGPYSLISKELFSFVKNNTEKNSTIIFFKPRVMRFFTGRNAIMIDRPKQLDRGKYICLRKINGLKKHGLKMKKISIEVEKLEANNQAKLIYENRDFEVYQLNVTRRKNK